MIDPANLTLSAALRAMKAGDLTAAALLEACLERINAREPEVLAWVTMDREAAREKAAAMDAAGRPGALGGIPVGLKDIIETSDFGTEYNSIIYKGYRPPVDAAVVSTLKNAGSNILGKTVTTTFAHRNPGPTRNPHNPGHSPGGSSSGSAAAVADGMIPLALGTQTGGSVLRPGAYCGVLAYKPAFDAINFGGTKQISATLDTLGFYVRSLDDIPIAGAALQGLEGGLPVGDDTVAPKITLIRTASWDQADQAARDLVEDVFDKLNVQWMLLISVLCSPVLKDKVQRHLIGLINHITVAFSHFATMIVHYARAGLEIFFSSGEQFFGGIRYIRFGPENDYMGKHCQGW